MPVIIPSDLVPGLKILSDPIIRKDVGINKDNIFVFPSTQLSEKRIEGNVAISNVCDKAKVVNKTTMTATSQRHNVSTIFATLDMPEKERELFLSHMGHSKKMNEDIYQAPAALMRIAKIGKRLQSIDEGAYFCTIKL